MTVSVALHPGPEVDIASYLGIEQNIHRTLKIQSDPQLAWEDYKIVLE